MPFTKKPTRKQLLRVICELQTLVGRAKGAYMNDRDPNRYDNVVNPLEEAFQKCLDAREFDP